MDQEWLPEIEMDIDPVTKTFTYNGFFLHDILKVQNL